MRIQVTFRGIAQLYRVMNKKWTIEIDVRGNTVADVISELIRKYGPVINRTLLDEQGDIDMELRVFRNQRTFLEYGQRMQAPLDDGDELLFMGFGITTQPF